MNEIPAINIARLFQAAESFSLLACSHPCGHPHSHLATLTGLVFAAHQTGRPALDKLDLRDPLI